MKLPKRPTERLTCGLDPSLTSFGVALYRPGVHETVALHPKTDGPERLRDLRDVVHDVLVEVTHELACVAIEGYSFQSKFSRAHALGEIGGVIRVMLYELFITRPSTTLIVIPPENLKKFCGVRKKEEMRLAAFKLWKFEAKSNDEVDAYALARYAAAYRGFEECTYAYQREALAALRKDKTHLLFC